MTAVVSFLALLLVSFSPWLATAYRDGAGRCLVGQASVDDTHSDPYKNRTTDTLQIGGFTMRVGSSTVGHEGFSTVGPLQFDFDFALLGNRNFKGILILFTDVYDTDASIVVDPMGNTLQAAERCPGQVAVTHVDASPKSSVSVAVSVDKEVVADVDITVVVENSDQLSEYYYSSFQLQVLNEYTFEFFDYCLNHLKAADRDNNLIFDTDEYFNFITLLGGTRKCYTPPANGQLTVEQKAAFDNLACTICVQNGNEPFDCCMDPTELPISGADASNMPARERYQLSTICQYTYSIIPPNCSD